MLSRVQRRKLEEKEKRDVSNHRIAIASLIISLISLIKSFF